MARSSRRRFLLALAAPSAFLLVVACNDLIGLSDYEKGECSGGGDCQDGGADVLRTDGPTIDVKTDVQPGGDGGGTKPVQWPQFRMPNYLQDGGPQENPATYVPAGGEVKETFSNLTWEEPVTPGPKTYQAAEAYCAGKTAGKWRLPSRIELVTLLDLDPGRNGVADAKINRALFKNTAAGGYWTRSEVRPITGSARLHWTVNFGTGLLGQQDVTQNAEVRCIKDQ